MFSGIIEKTSRIIKISPGVIVIENVFDDLKCGESISVNGVCLTIFNFNQKVIFFNLSEETYRITTFKYLKIKDVVNLERSLKLGDRINGHIVTGHIDEVAKITQINKLTSSYIFKFRVKTTTLLCEKGSVCVNGISLTSFDIKDDSFVVSVIDYTYNNTNLKDLRVNSPVNIEYDILSKYLLKKKNNMDLNFLKENGFL